MLSCFVSCLRTVRGRPGFFLFQTCIFIALNTREAGRKYLVKLIEFLSSFFLNSSPAYLPLNVFNDSAAFRSSERGNTRKPIKMCSTSNQQSRQKEDLEFLLKFQTKKTKQNKTLSHRRLLLDAFFFSLSR